MSLRTSKLEAAFQSFAAKLTSRFTFDDFHFWRELFMNIYVSKKACHLLCMVTKHWKLKSTYTEFIKIMSNMLKCISQVCIQCKAIIFTWNLSAGISTLMSNGITNTLSVVSYSPASWKWKLNSCWRSCISSMNFLT